jgi:hypothetical protein
LVLSWIAPRAAGRTSGLGDAAMFATVGVMLLIRGEQAPIGSV